MIKQTTTMTVISHHIELNEKRIKHPYLDIKGHVTIGAGFKIDNDDDFAALDLQVRKDGAAVPATEGEKRAAFRHMQKIVEDQNGDFDKKADSYKDKVNIQMSEGAINTKLEQEITTRVDKIKNDVGEAAWDKLNDAQKAATVDVVYATGSLGPNMADAIRKGVTQWRLSFLRIMVRVTRSDIWTSKAT